MSISYLYYGNFTLQGHHLKMFTHKINRVYKVTKCCFYNHLNTILWMFFSLLYLIRESLYRI